MQCHVVLQSRKCAQGIHNAKKLLEVEGQHKEGDVAAAAQRVPSIQNQAVEPPPTTDTRARSRLQRARRARRTPQAAAQSKKEVLAMSSESRRTEGSAAPAAAA